MFFFSVTHEHNSRTSQQKESINSITGPASQFTRKRPSPDSESRSIYEPEEAILTGKTWASICLSDNSIHGSGKEHESFPTTISSSLWMPQASLSDVLQKVPPLPANYRRKLLYHSFSTSKPLQHSVSVPPPRPPHHTPRRRFRNSSNSNPAA
jgi:hypothetical protein